MTEQTKKAPSNLLLRVATAVVAVPLILLLLYKGPPWGFFLLVFPASLIGAWELFGMTHKGDRAAIAIGVALTAIASATLYRFGSDPRVAMTLLVAMPLAGPLLTLVRLGDIPSAALRACSMAMGPLYIGAPMTMLAMLRRDYEPSYVVLPLMFAWFADTGGYFAGRFLGKHKLYEAVSPKKTVEGALGGTAASILGGVLAHYWFLPNLPLAHAIPLALVASVLGQAGDLGESLLKRSCGVKDSGQIVPGHGGILDRVDAVLCTTTVVYLYALWVLPR